jgi:hypothetical protein
MVVRRGVAYWVPWVFAAMRFCSSLRQRLWDEPAE